MSKFETPQKAIRYPKRISRPASAPSARDQAYGKASKIAAATTNER